MRHIDKMNDNQPNFLLEFRMQSEINVNYEELRKLIDNSGEKYCRCEGTKLNPEIGEFQTQLLKEQGYLCAYCNDRIPEFKKVKSKKYCKTKVEHWHPQSSKFSDNNQLDTDYQNMFICCMGGESNSLGDNNQENHYCDTAKGESFITLDPRERNHINKLKYTNNGQIYCFDYDDKATLKSEYDKIKNSKATPMQYKNGEIGYFLKAEYLTEEELNIAIQYDIEFTLNLNTTKLKNQRAAKWKDIESEVSYKFNKPHFLSEQKKQFIDSKTQFFDVPNQEGKYEPMCMVKIFYLRRRKKNLN